MSGTSQITFNLKNTSEFAGWLEGKSPGTYNIGIKATADPDVYEDSDVAPLGTFLIASITPTLNNCTAKTGNPTTIPQGFTKQLIFYADEDYTFSEDIEEAIANASGFSLSNATWTLVEQFPITVTATNCTEDADNPVAIYADETAELKFTFDGTSYVCPDTAPTVTGATVDAWQKVDDTHGTLVISTATGAVSVSVEGEEANATRIS